MDTRADRRCGGAGRQKHAVTEAGLTDLEAVEGVSKTLAKAIYGYFHEGA